MWYVESIASTAYLLLTTTLLFLFAVEEELDTVRPNVKSGDCYGSAVFRKRSLDSRSGCEL
jgi:hypothetical protein